MVHGQNDQQDNDMVITTRITIMNKKYVWFMAKMISI